MGAYKRAYKRKGRIDATVWYFQFMFRKTRYCKSGFLTRKEAQDAEFQKRSELKSKRNRPISKERVSFSQWLPKFIEHRHVMGKAPRTVSHEKLRGQFLCRHFGNMVVSEIDPQDIEDYIAIRQKAGLLPRTINLELTFLRSFFKNAMQNHLVASNPAREIANIPDSDRAEVWIPNEAEFQRFVLAAEAFPAYHKVFAAWVWFSALTGTRPAESCFIEWDDIDFENDRIWIRPKPGNPIKNRRRRYLPLHPQLKPILLKWKDDWEQAQGKRIKRNGRRDETAPAAQAHNWVFFSTHNHDIHANSFRRLFQRAKELANLPRMTPYTLRHFFISQAIMSGIDSYTISKWVGHRDTLMIERVYGHISQDYSAEEMAKLRIVPPP